MEALYTMRLAGIYTYPCQDHLLNLGSELHDERREKPTC